MASSETSRDGGTVTPFDLAHQAWLRLQMLSDEAACLPPSPRVEALQNSTFEACERAEEALLALAPRSDREAATLIEVLLGNEEVAGLGGPVLRKIQAYLSASTGVSAARRSSSMRDQRGGRRPVAPQCRWGGSRRAEPGAP